MTYLRNAFIVLSILGAIGCQPITNATASSETVTVFRLNPQFADKPEDDSRPQNYEFETLAQRVVTDASLVKGLKDAIDDPTHFEGPARSRCFLPRLMVRILNGNHWTDYVICTECRRMDTHTWDGESDSSAISQSGCDVFDDLMKELFPQYIPHSNEHLQ